MNGYARFVTAPDYPFGWDPDALAAVGRDVLTPDVRGLDLLTIIAPAVASDQEFRAWWDRAGRRAASPKTAQLLRGVIGEADVRSALVNVSAPVLLINREGGFSYNVGHGHYLAAHLTNATTVSYNDPNDPWWTGDGNRVVDELDRFVAGLRPAG